MPKIPYFSNYVSPNIVIVPTVSCYGTPPKKQKLDKNVPNTEPISENTLKSGNCSNISDSAVPNQTCESSSITVKPKQGPDKSLQSSPDDVPKSALKNINDNSSGVQSMSKPTKQVSWASNYLMSIGQLNYKPIKLNLSTPTKKILSAKESTSASTSKIKSEEESKKTSTMFNVKEGTTNLTRNYKIPLKTSNTTPKFSPKDTNTTTDKIKSIISKINNDTLYSIKQPNKTYDFKKISSRVTEHSTEKNISNGLKNLNNSVFKHNSENYKALPESVCYKNYTKSLSTVQNDEWKSDKNYENAKKAKSLNPIKHSEVEKKDNKNKCDGITNEKPVPVKKRDSEDKSCDVQSGFATKKTADQSKRSAKPLKISDFYQNKIDADKNRSKSINEKSLKISKIQETKEKEDKERKGSDKEVRKRKGSDKVKKRKESDKVEKNHSMSSKKFQDLIIKTKSKKYKFETDNASSKNFKINPSTSYSSSTNVYGKHTDRRSSKDLIKSTVRVPDSSKTDNRLYHKHNVDKNFDLRTKLSQKSLSNYFTKIQNEFKGDSVRKEERENLIITVQNEDNDAQTDLKERETSHVDGSKQISISRENNYKNINVVINVICQQPLPQKPEKNENNKLNNEDLSFLDDFNVDEIVETLKHCENKSSGTNHNVELNIEVRAGGDKTIPVTLDISNNKIMAPETTRTVARSPRRQTSVIISNRSPAKVKSENYGNEYTCIHGTKMNCSESEDIFKDQELNNEVVQQLPSGKNIVETEIVKVIKRENIETVEENVLNSITKTITANSEVYNKQPVGLIRNIKKEPGIENNDEPNRQSNVDVASENRTHDYESGVHDAIEIKSEPQTDAILSNPVINCNSQQKLQELYTEINSVVDLPEATNLNIDSIHEDDDNASDTTLVLSPPRFGDFNLIDLSIESNIENHTETENVKKEIETTIETVDNHFENSSVIHLCYRSSSENVNYTENYYEAEMNESETKPTKLDLSDMSAPNEFVKLKSTESQTSFNTTKTDVSYALNKEKSLNRKNKDEESETNPTKVDLSDTSAPNECVKLKSMESQTSSSTTKAGTCALNKEKSLKRKNEDKESETKPTKLDLSDANAPNESVKLKSTESKTSSNTTKTDVSCALNEEKSLKRKNEDKESETKPTKLDLSDTSASNEPVKLKSTKSQTFSNTTEAGACALNKENSLKRKNEDIINEGKSKIIKIDECPTNNNTITVSNELYKKKEQQQGINVEELDKEFVHNLEERMLSYLYEQYNIISVIHKGKFSDIYSCKNSYGKIFAVKVIKNDRSTKNILEENMLKEIQKEIPKANNNCVYICDGFSLPGFRCLLMEYYPRSLHEIFSKTRKPLCVNVVQTLAKQLVAAVTVLRNNKIVHSDICPRHILISQYTNQYTRLKLCGFDRSYYIDEARVIPNIGTASYRAPEIILGFSAGYSIDVWSTALVIYEMATGVKLFSGLFNNDILYQQLCTFGNVPSDMLEKSAYRAVHFLGPRTFKRRTSRFQMTKISVDTFFNRNRLRNTFFLQQKIFFGKSLPKLAKKKLYENVNSLCILLEGMLVIHPNHRQYNMTSFDLLTPLI